MEQIDHAGVRDLAWVVGRGKRLSTVMRCELRDVAQRRTTGCYDRLWQGPLTGPSIRTARPTGCVQNTFPFSFSFLTTTGLGPDAVADDRPRTLTGCLTAALKQSTSRRFTP